MKNIELITAENADRINEIGQDLAESYKVAFAGPPWNEVGKCIQQECLVQLVGQEPGCACLGCGELLVEAYNATELVTNWGSLLINDNALIEVSFTDGLAQRATIARPTSASEL